MELKGVKYLKTKLKRKYTRVQTRYNYYEMKHKARDFQISSPPELRFWMGTLGWCAKSVDSLADRLVFREFGNDAYDMNGIFAQNNKAVLTDSAALSSLISSCSFIYLTTDQDGQPRMKVIDGRHATGEIDPTTNMLREGYAVLEYDDHDNPLLEVYCTPGATKVYVLGKETETIPNDAPYPLLVPIINRPDAVRPFGHSRISRACMAIQDSAVRTAKRSEIAAEFFSFPQKYALGLEKGAIDALDPWTAAMSSLFMISRDSDGQLPTLGQFQQQSMAPHTEQLRMFAGLFAGETGLTLDDLGFPSQNPSSAEAIKSSHESLRLTARKAQRDFGNGFRNAGYLAACLRDKKTYDIAAVADTVAKWEPIFEPDYATLSNIGDGLLKINQAVPGYFDKEVLRDMTGIEPNVEESIGMYSPEELDKELEV